MAAPNQGVPLTTYLQSPAATRAARERPLGRSVGERMGLQGCEQRPGCDVGSGGGGAEKGLEFDGSGICNRHGMRLHTWAEGGGMGPS
jgi:hypothetical protein